MNCKLLHAKLNLNISSVDSNQKTKSINMSRDHIKIRKMRFSLERNGIIARGKIDSFLLLLTSSFLSSFFAGSIYVSNAISNVQKSQDIYRLAINYELGVYTYAYIPEMNQNTMLINRTSERREEKNTRNRK